MAISKVALANIALTKIGGRIITSFSEDTPEARALSLIYDDTRDEVLTEHLWTFAQKRVVLATLAITPVMTEDGMTIVYSKPSDLLKINYISDKNALVKVESDGILSDTAGLKMIYTYRNDDPSTYFSKFTDAFATRLAYGICFKISESMGMASDLFKEYEMKLSSAISSDSQQGSPIQINQDEWEIGRNTGANTFVTRTNIWHPK